MFLHQHASIIAMFLFYFQDSLTEAGLFHEPKWRVEDCKMIFSRADHFWVITFGLPKVSMVSCVSGNG